MTNAVLSRHTYIVLHTDGILMFYELFSVPGIPKFDQQTSCSDSASKDTFLHDGNFQVVSINPQSPERLILRALLVL